MQYNKKGYTLMLCNFITLNKTDDQHSEINLNKNNKILWLNKN